jgi:hypothetical protein
VIEREDSGWLVHGGIETLEREQDQAATISKLNDRQADCLELVQERWQEDLQRTTANDAVAGLAIKGKDAQTMAARTLKQLERKGLVEAIRQPDEFGCRGAYAFRPTTDALPTVSRGGQKNSVGSVGSVGSDALACEDPERNDYLKRSSHPTTDTTDTTDDKNGSPTRGVDTPSVVGKTLAKADWLPIAVGSGADAFADGDDPAWGPRPSEIEVA